MSTSVTVGRPSVMVPVLSSTTVVTSPARWSASPPLIRMPSSAPLPVATITAVGTASPMAQGQAMISTATAAAKARTAEPSATYQVTKVAMASEITTGTKMPLTRSASRWMGAREPWASRISLTIRASSAVRAERRGPVAEGARAVDRAADHPVASLLLDRHRFAGEHRLVHGAGAREHLAVHRHPLAGADGHRVAAPHLLHRYVDLPVLAQDARRLRLQGDQGAQGGRGTALGPRLERVAGEDEGDDDDHRLVVDVRRHSPREEEAGDQRGERGVEERRARAHGHEGVHVRRVVAEAGPGPRVEMPAGPGHHPQREGEQGIGEDHGRNPVEPG